VQAHTLEVRYGNEFFNTISRSTHVVTLVAELEDGDVGDEGAELPAPLVPDVELEPLEDPPVGAGGAPLVGFLTVDVRPMVEESFDFSSWAASWGRWLSAWVFGGEAEAPSDSALPWGERLSKPGMLVGYIMTLGVHFRFRRKGLARKLLLAGLSVCRERFECAVAQLHCLPINRSAIRLYASLGFVLVEERIGYYSIGGASYDCWELQARIE
jgi:ribosomal protein S18 acetylase RimI-like enzyme